MRLTYQSSTMNLIEKLEFINENTGQFEYVRAYRDMNTLLDHFSFMAVLQKTRSGCFDPNDDLWRVNKSGFIDSLTEEQYEYEVYQLRYEIEEIWRNNT